MIGTMLDIAKVDLQSAKILFRESDDGQLRNAAYHAQQAVEKVIKYLYECHGVRYPFGHDISTLLSTLPQEQTCFSQDILDELLIHADTYTAWEQKTRYPNDYMAVRRLVEIHIALADELVKLASDYMLESSERAVSAKDTIVTVKKMNLFGDK